MYTFSYLRSRYPFGSMKAAKTVNFDRNNQSYFHRYLNIYISTLWVQKDPLPGISLIRQSRIPPPLYTKMGISGLRSKRRVFVAHHSGFVTTMAITQLPPVLLGLCVSLGTYRWSRLRNLFECCHYFK
jgi:hypothetical protein